MARTLSLSSLAIHLSAVRGHTYGHWQMKSNLNTTCSVIVRWYQSNWSPCSRTCGKGIQKRRIYCRRRITQVRHQRLSESSCSGAKPPGPTKQSCNAIICHAKWIPTTWSEVYMWVFVFNGRNKNTQTKWMKACDFAYSTQWVPPLGRKLCCLFFYFLALSRVNISQS